MMTPAGAGGTVFQGDDTAGSWFLKPAISFKKCWGGGGGYTAVLEKKN